MDKLNKYTLLKKMPTPFGFTVSFDEHLQNESSTKQQMNIFRSKSSTIFSRSKILKKLSADTLKCPDGFPENELVMKSLSKNSLYHHRENKRESLKSSNESVNSMVSLRQSSIDENSETYFCTEQRPAICDRLTSLRLKLRRCSVSMDSQSSSATELISRRGVFSRRHYGSVDQLPQTDLEGLDQNCRRFRLENGESLAEIDEVFGSPSTPILENPEHQTRWYFKYFLGKLHQNYVGIDIDKNPYFLSIVSQDSTNKSIPLYRAILFRKQGAQKLALPYTPQQKLTVKQLLSHFSTMDTSKSPKELFSADIQKDLLLLEEQEGSVNFKFGVVYMKNGQKCDDEMLSNEIGSPEFDEFLNVLGEKIRLKGWERFRGGLDVKGDMTGTHSIYTLYEGHEIMFHVSTLLPFSRDNKQQVERKRHIGNDIINIVFIDGDSGGCEFSPNCIKSQFTHVFAVVTRENDLFKLAIYCDETVPPFGPTLPNPPIFQDPIALREFLLVKLINGEKATFQTPTFSRKRERTLEMLIKDLYEEYVHDTKMNMLNRRAFSEVLYDAPRTSKLKEDARQVEFVRIGQALKLEAIVRGDAPTSLASTGTGSVFKRPPWEPQCFYAAFYQRGTIIGDSYGHDSIVLGTDEGTFLIREDQSHQLVFDKSFCARQISVVEDHGIMLIRGGLATHKEGHRIYVFKLTEFRDEKLKIRSRLDIRNRRLEKTKGCHLYTISKGGDGHLRMAVAIGKKMFIFQWKYTAAWTSWCPNNDFDPIEGFILLKEINLHDSPTIMTILEGPANKNSGLLTCVGYKHHFEIVCEQSGICTKLHEVETAKRSQTQLITAVDLCDGQETELLLCYNHTCHFQKLQDDSKSTEFDFQWNTSPTSIVCAFPYIIAFTSDSMEIRLLVNGNLVHTVTMANLQLITSKRDIYFATTAPEFIPKDLHIKGLENESANHYYGSLSPINMNQFSNERILEIKHKIDKIENQSQGLMDATTDNIPPVHINSVDNLTKYLPIPGSTENSPSIYRARSLQKPRFQQDHSDDLKRQMSKSSSCGDAPTCSTTSDKDHNEPDVPPNSPKKDSLESLLGSPTKRFNSKSYPHSKVNLSNSNIDIGSPEKIKPLRIFRIPLSNLTGAHSHYHTHNSTATKSAKLKTQKIAEDHLEVDDNMVDQIDSKCDSLFLQNSEDIDNNSCNCVTPPPLFSSI